MPSTPFLIDTILDQFNGAKVVLFTDLPEDSNSWVGTQPSGGSYSPQTANFLLTPADSTTGSNSTLIVFNDLPACTVVGMGYTTVSGDVLHFDSLGSPAVFSAGEDATVAVNALKVSVG